MREVVLGEIRYNLKWVEAKLSYLSADGLKAPIYCVLLHRSNICSECIYVCKLWIPQCRSGVNSTFKFCFSEIMVKFMRAWEHRPKRGCSGINLMSG